MDNRKKVSDIDIPIPKSDKYIDKRISKANSIIDNAYSDLDKELENNKLKQELADLEKQKEIEDTKQKLESERQILLDKIAKLKQELPNNKEIKEPDKFNKVPVDKIVEEYNSFPQIETKLDYSFNAQLEELKKSTDADNLKKININKDFFGDSDIDNDIAQENKPLSQEELNKIIDNSLNDNKVLDDVPLPPPIYNTNNNKNNSNRETILEQPKSNINNNSTTKKPIDYNNTEELLKTNLTKEDFEYIKNKLEMKLEKERIHFVNNIKRTYLSLGIICTFMIGVIIATFVFKLPNIVKFGLWFLLIPTVALTIIFVVIRLFVFDDLAIIKGKIIIQFSHDFLIANFFLTQHRVYKIVVLLNGDGKSFNLGEKIYMVDYDTIWLDDNNYPNAYYVPNIPNPIKFDFTKYLKIALHRFKDGTINKLDDDLDVLYSAENLGIMKKDKFINELHRDKSEELNKLLTFFLIFAVVAIIAVVIIVIVMGNKQQAINIVVNATKIPIGGQPTF